MKVKNEYVKIKTENNEIVLHNYIYDSYLELFSKGQYLIDRDIYSNKFLGNCYLRLEEPLEDYKNAKIDDFQVKIEYDQYNITGNENKVDITYIYKLVEEAQSRQIEPRKENQKVTAIGFGSNFGDEIYACIDTSNYTLYYNDYENFIITRKDTFSSEALCDGYEYPVHLIPSTEYEKTRIQDYKRPLAVLYSVGYGTQRGKIQNRRFIHNDFDVEQISNTEYCINFKIEENKNIYPQINRYAGNNKYPRKFYARKEILPNIDIYPSNKKFPLASNIKYLIYEFQLYYIDFSKGGFDGEIIKTDNFYTMSYPLKKTTGLFKLKNKIERK